MGPKTKSPFSPTLGICGRWSGTNIGLNMYFNACKRGSNVVYWSLVISTGGEKFHLFARRSHCNPRGERWFGHGQSGRGPICAAKACSSLLAAASTTWGRGSLTIRSSSTSTSRTIPSATSSARPTTPRPAVDATCPTSSRSPPCIARDSRRNRFDASRRNPCANTLSSTRPVTARITNVSTSSS